MDSRRQMLVAVPLDLGRYKSLRIFAMTIDMDLTENSDLPIGWEGLFLLFAQCGFHLGEAEETGGCGGIPGCWF